ncbi:Glyoxylate reductase/hydroxypyruvate reductase [Armadillidium vulgare]|nr:Glyoxylate reductase/hydroxypyruvate reductase [Armadillidium vulgare]
MPNNKFKVLVTRQDIPKEAITRLQEECEVEIYPQSRPIPRDELLKRVKGKDGVYCLSDQIVDKEFLDAAGPSLKAGNTPGVVADSTAELAVSLMLATTRRFFDSHKQILNGGWANSDRSPLWNLGWGVSGSTVGIFGLGNIGKEVIKKLQGFNVKSFLYNSRTKKSKEEELSAKFVSFDELLRKSDFIIITCSFNADTKEIFNKDAFSRMKENAIVINVSRGALLPHIGTAELRTRRDMAVMSANNIIAALKNEKMPTSLPKTFV